MLILCHITPHLSRLILHFCGGYAHIHIHIYICTYALMGGPPSFFPSLFFLGSFCFSGPGGPHRRGCPARP